MFTGNQDQEQWNWRTRSACRFEDPELFFPVGTSGPALRQTDEAKSVCLRCPVRSECLAWAFRHGAEVGIWGGMSEDERGALRANNRQRVS